MPKCVFFEITVLHGCSSVNLLYFFRPPFPKNTSGGMLLLNVLWNKCGHVSMDTQKNASPSIYVNLFVAATLLLYRNCKLRYLFHTMRVQTIAIKSGL